MTEAPTYIAVRGFSSTGGTGNKSVELGKSEIQFSGGGGGTAGNWVSITQMVWEPTGNNAYTGYQPISFGKGTRSLTVERQGSTGGFDADGNSPETVTGPGDTLFTSDDLYTTQDATVTMRVTPFTGSSGTGTAGDAVTLTSHGPGKVSRTVTVSTAAPSGSAPVGAIWGKY